MEFDSVVSVHDIKKKYKGFELDVQSLEIPKGFATAIIGENGAGKTTLMDIMAGVKLDYKGSIKYFGKYTDEDRENNPEVKSRIGYTATGNYYIASWNLLQVKELLKLLFEDFNEEKYDGFIKDLGILKEGIKESSKKVGDLSKKDEPNYSICENNKLKEYSSSYYNRGNNLSAIQICMLVNVFFENEKGLWKEECEARTSFVENGKKMSEMDWYKDSILVFDCDNNDNAQYLEECLAAMGIWTSKGSGRQSEENSKFVFVTKKTKEELEFRAKVEAEYCEKVQLEQFNRLLTTKF